MYDIVKIAREQLGYTERSDGWTKYGQWYADKIAKDQAFANAPWCAMIVSYCAEQAGILDGEIFPNTSPQGSSCPSMLKWFEEHGCRYPASELPMVGDVVFFSWDSKRNADHVGIIDRVSGCMPSECVIRSVEGNISNKVITRSIDYTDNRVLATVRPKYKTTYDDALTTMANMCIEGFMGGGDERERLLYDAIQGRVNQLLM